MPLQEVPPCRALQKTFATNRIKPVQIGFIIDQVILHPQLCFISVVFTNPFSKVSGRPDIPVKVLLPTDEINIVHISHSVPYPWENVKNTAKKPQACQALPLSR